MVLGAVPFDLTGDMYRMIEEDYEDIRWLVRNEGINAVHGGLGRFCRPGLRAVLAPGQAAIVCMREPVSWASYLDWKMPFNRRSGTWLRKDASVRPTVFARALDRLIEG